MQKPLALAVTAGVAISILCVGACGGAGDASGAGDGLPSEDGGTTEPPPPEEEDLESSFGVPATTGKFVWVANPTSGRVAYIDATSFAIALVDAGNGPTHLAPIPDPAADVAIVLNVASADATLLRYAEGQLTTRTIAVPTSGNGWAISASGRFATAWTDARAIEAPDPIDGYQDLTVIDLATDPPTSTSLAVGYRPSAIAYDADEEQLFAITKDGISTVALADGPPQVSATIPIAQGLPASATFDVSLTPDGAWALVRIEGSPEVQMISLETGEVTPVALPSAPSDLDLAPSGEVAVAVLRDSAEVALLPVPGIALAPADYTLIAVEGEPAGSVSIAAEAPVAFLYSTGIPSAVLRTMRLDEPAPELTETILVAPILSVVPTPDASDAIVVHDPSGLEGSKYHSAVSLVPVATGAPAKVFGLDADIQSIAIGPGTSRALIATDAAEGVAPQLFVADLSSQLLTEYTLASRPLASGIVIEAGRGYVAQEHPEGRITFVDFATGELRTMTGFELATQVVQGSEP